MQRIGANFRRKSYENVQPVLPRKVYSREEGTRTLYKQFASPTDQLKTFRRKLLFQSLPSIDSLPDIHKNSSHSNNKLKSNDGSKVNQQKSRKNNPTLMTMGSQTEWKIQKQQNPQQQPQIQKKQHLQQPIQIQKLNIDIENENNDAEVEQDVQKQGQNIEVDQGYTMGNQIKQQQYQQQNKPIPKLKSFSTDANYINKNITRTYQTVNEAQARMERRFIKSKFQHYRSKKQNDQIMEMINRYKINKQLIEKQTKKKTQTMKTLASIRRAASLPRLSQTYNNHIDVGITVPSYQQLTNPDGNPEQNKRKILGKRLQVSLSFGRLQMGNSRNKNKNYQGYLEEQISYALETERILREKGITLDSNTLKSSLINIRQVPVSISEQIPFPAVKLISNPLLPKQKPKKKKK